MTRSLHNTVAHALMSEPQSSQVAGSSQLPVLQTPAASPVVSCGRSLHYTFHSTMTIPIQKKRGSGASTSGINSHSPPKRGRGAGTSARTTRSGAGQRKGKDNEDDSSITAPENMQVD